MKVLVLFVVTLFCYRSVAASSIVVPTTSEPSNDATQNTTVTKPEIYYLHVNSDVKYRYARTLVSARIANPANVAQEIQFSAVIPDSAFISDFLIELDNNVYKAYVKEKEEAKKEYDEAVQHGQTAAHVALTARDSNRFTVSVNVEPQKKITFNLTYEELLSRTLGLYKDVINLDPGQIVPDLKVKVEIVDSSAITTLRVPELKVSNELSANDSQDTTNPLATIEQPTPETAVVTFAPTPQQQKQLAKDGIKGQLIVEYDVNRTANPGEIFVSDGYFVHFFSPTDLKPLPKYVTFVLDLSGSMSGRKIEQLREAMHTILADLHPQDLFSIVLFSSTAQVWDPKLSDAEMDERLRSVGSYYGFQDEAPPPTATPSVIVKVNNDTIAKAQEFVKKLRATSSTNIYDGLMLAVAISKLERLTVSTATPGDQAPEPIIIFLTDGLPNVRVSVPDTIVDDVTKANTAKSSIFSLGLGDDVNFDFLKKLSLSNTGFARRIYEAGDAHLQLHQFYSEISSPLLANVTFQYVPSDVDNSTVSKHEFRRLFAGSELVVAGRLTDDDKNFTSEVQGTSVSGKTEYRFRPVIIPFPPHFPHHPVHNHTPSFMERLWAYITIKQLLAEDQAKDYDHNNMNQTSPEKQKALELSIKYSFVTPLTSLVVVKPNETKAVDTQDASRPDSGTDHLHNRGFISFNNAVIFADNRLAYNPGGPVRGLSTPVYFPMRTVSTCLDTLNTVTWLNGSSTINLPTGPNKSDQVLQVAPDTEVNTAYANCTTPRGEAGHCRHLRFCVLDTFTNSQDDFLPYFCDINSYVGVCCPDVPNLPQNC